MITKTTNLISRHYFDETGAAVDTAGSDHPSMFPGGVEAWKKYLYNHLYFPRGYRITNADTAVSVVTFTVGADGKVKDAFVSTPFFPEFDRIALNAVMHCPLWVPAVQHNQKIPYSQTTVVFFSQKH